MLRRTAMAKAPAKGHFFQRIIAPDFMGINWSKVTWGSPYSNFYPITMTAGGQGRYWSNFIGFGHFSNRMTRCNLRNIILFGPTALLGFVLLFQIDWYNAIQCAYYFPGWEIPEWAQKERAEELRLASWYKPGVFAKHHWGGQISIPGSEALVA